MRAAPGGPFDQEQALPPEIMANLQRAYGLDQPVWTQYGRYLESLLHGDFGPSFKYKDFTVTELIGQGFPVTLQLGIDGDRAGLDAWAFRSERLPRSITTRRPTTPRCRWPSSGIAIPSFVVLPFLGLLFGVYLHWLPVAGWEAGIDAPPRAARDRIGVAAAGVYRAPDPRQHARSAAQPLHSHRVCQRVAAAYA